MDETVDQAQDYYPPDHVVTHITAQGVYSHYGACPDGGHVSGSTDAGAPDTADAGTLKPDAGTADAGDGATGD